MMIDGNKLGDVGFNYLGVPYSQMDCQRFVEKCLSDCGCHKDLAGSNAWFREVYKNGAIMTPEECVRQLGYVPKGAFLFILEHDGKEPEKYKPDGLGNASHIGICTMPRGEGAIHSSSSRGCVAESKFKGKTINGGWNRVGLWDQVSYDYGGGGTPAPEPKPVPTPGEDMPTLRKGDSGEYVTLLQTKLIQHGYSLDPYGADGKFGNTTLKAVKQFQTDHGLAADGVVGKNTWGALLSGETMLYTVTIPHLPKFKAEALIKDYAGSSMIEERG